MVLKSEQEKNDDLEVLSTMCEGKKMALELHVQNGGKGGGLRNMSGYELLMRTRDIEKSVNSG